MFIYMQSYKLEYIRSYSYLVILKVVSSLFTIYFKLENIWSRCIFMGVCRERAC